MFIDDCLKGTKLVTASDFVDPLNIGSSTGEWKKPTAGFMTRQKRAQKADPMSRPTTERTVRAKSPGSTRSVESISRPVGSGAAA
jgi:hypothetical protein